MGIHMDPYGSRGLGPMFPVFFFGGIITNGLLDQGWIFELNLSDDLVLPRGFSE